VIQELRAGARAGRLNAKAVSRGVRRPMVALIVASLDRKAAAVRIETNRLSVRACQHVAGCEMQFTRTASRHCRLSRPRSAD
jgi:hypothetical protein